MKKTAPDTSRLVFISVMAAIICVVTLLRFPLLGSKVHFANALCLLAGMLFGGVGGGLAAGLGSALYDGLLGGYDIFQCLITFVSKFLMAFICARIAWGGGARAERHGRNAVACVAGALSYVALYMLKTFVYQKFIYAYPADAVWLTMLGKLPASLINSAVAMIAAPILYAGLLPALKKAGILEKLRPRTPEA